MKLDQFADVTCGAERDKLSDDTCREGSGISEAIGDRVAEISVIAVGVVWSIGAASVGRADIIGAADSIITGSVIDGEGAAGRWVGVGERWVAEVNGGAGLAVTAEKVNGLLYAVLDHITRGQSTSSAVAIRAEAVVLGVGDVAIGGVTGIDCAANIVVDRGQWRMGDVAVGGVTGIISAGVIVVNASKRSVGYAGVIITGVVGAGVVVIDVDWVVRDDAISGVAGVSGALVVIIDTSEGYMADRTVDSVARVGGAGVIVVDTSERSVCDDAGLGIAGISGAGVIVVDTSEWCVDNSGHRVTGINSAGVVIIDGDVVMRDDAGLGIAGISGAGVIVVDVGYRRVDNSVDWVTYIIGTKVIVIKVCGRVLALSGAADIVGAGVTIVAVGL
jgi:hypothetical protein